MRRRAGRDTGRCDAAARGRASEVGDRSRRKAGVRGRDQPRPDGPHAGGIGWVAGPRDVVPARRDPAHRHRHRPAGRVYFGERGRDPHLDRRDRDAGESGDLMVVVGCLGCLVVETPNIPTTQPLNNLSMSDADALLRAILAAQEDDAPRLVYADWLEEHGEGARATFIRAQVELARLPADDPSRTALVQTERTLLNANRKTWTEWLPGWVSDHEFRRGFIEWIQCQAADFIAQSDYIRQQTPLRGARLDGKQPIAVAIFRSRALEGLRSLTLSVKVPSLAWDHLASCPYLSQLAELEVLSSAHADELVSALVSSTSLPAIRSLRLKWCALGDEHTSNLVRHRWSERLRDLDLSNNHIGPEGGLAIVESPFLDGLEHLNLNANPLLANAGVVQKLRNRFGMRVYLQVS